MIFITSVLTAVSFHDGKISVLMDAEKTNTAALEDALKKRGVEFPPKR